MSLRAIASGASAAAFLFQGPALFLAQPGSLLGCVAGAGGVRGGWAAHQASATLRAYCSKWPEKERLELNVILVFEIWLNRLYKPPRGNHG